MCRGVSQVGYRGPTFVTIPLVCKQGLRVWGAWHEVSAHLPFGTPSVTRPEAGPPGSSEMPLPELPHLIIEWGYCFSAPSSHTPNILHPGVTAPHVHLGAPSPVAGWRGASERSRALCRELSTAQARRVRPPVRSERDSPVPGKGC